MRAPKPKAKKKAAREGAHDGESEAAGTVRGNAEQAASQRQRAQQGVGAAARRGQLAVRSRAAERGKVPAAVQKEELVLITFTQQ